MSDSNTLVAEPTITEIISATVRENMHADFEWLTDEVFNQVVCSEECAALFRPLVRWAVSRTHRSFVRTGDRRERVRAIAAKEDAEQPPPVRSKSRGGVPVSRPAFLAETIETFGPRGRVALGEMTVEEHRTRIEHQLKLAGGIKRDIDKHTDAINRIEAAGVSCLNDLPEYGGKRKAAA